MSEQQKMAQNLRRFRIAVTTHDVENPTHTTLGIGVSHFDLERLGFEDGETLWGSITIHADGKTSGNFRVICDGEHDDCKPKTLEEKEALEGKGYPAPLIIDEPPLPAEREKELTPA